jgi:hypothetical protein
MADDDASIPEEQRVLIRIELGGQLGLPLSAYAQAIESLGHSMLEQNDPLEPGIGIVAEAMDDDDQVIGSAELFILPAWARTSDVIAVPTDAYSPDEIARWFGSRSSKDIARVIAVGQNILDQRFADGVFE